MKNIILATVVIIASSVTVLAAGPGGGGTQPGGGGNQPGGGGNQPGGNQPSGPGGSSATFTFDTFLEAATTNSNGTITRAGRLDGLHLGNRVALGRIIGFEAGARRLLRLHHAYERRPLCLRIAHRDTRFRVLRLHIACLGDASFRLHDDRAERFRGLHRADNVQRFGGDGRQPRCVQKLLGADKPETARNRRFVRLFAVRRDERRHKRRDDAG